MKRSNISVVTVFLILLLAGTMFLRQCKARELSPDRNRSVETRAGGILASPGTGIWEPVGGIGPVENLLALQFAPDGSQGVAMGSRGELIITRDGGTTWESRGSVTLAEMLVATCVASPQAGRILFGTTVDEDWPASTIYEFGLSDGAQRRIWQGEHGGLLAVSSDGRFWAGENCFVLRLDGGSFIPLRLPSCEGEVIYDIESSSGHVLAVGLNGLAAFSRDGGDTWKMERLKSASGSGGEPSGIHRVAVSGQMALAGGSYGALWRSEDAGWTWAPVRGLGKTTNVWALYLAPDGVTGYVGGGNDYGGAPFIMATGDGGRTFMHEPVRGSRGRVMGIARGKAGIFAVTFDGRVLVRRGIS